MSETKLESFWETVTDWCSWSVLTWRRTFGKPFLHNWSTCMCMVTLVTSLLLKLYTCQDSSILECTTFLEGRKVLSVWFCVQPFYTCSVIISTVSAYNGRHHWKVSSYILLYLSHTHVASGVFSGCWLSVNRSWIDLSSYRNTAHVNILNSHENNDKYRCTASNGGHVYVQKISGAEHTNAHYIQFTLLKSELPAI